MSAALRVVTAMTLAAGCGSTSGTDPLEPRCATPTWREAAGTLDRSVLAAWGRAHDDVYVVGGDLGAGGTGALLAHWDGATFTEIPTGQEHTLWWIWGTPDGETLWLVGEGGTVLRRAGDTFETIPSGTEATLFGVWGSGADDVWIVGGVPGAGEPEKDMVLHWDGTELRREVLPAPRQTTLLKIWGSGKDDLWVGGEGGTLWHKGPGGWSDRSAEVPTFYSLNSVHGCSASEVYAVGGQAIFRFDGSAWAPVTEAQDMISGSAVGVSCGPGAVAVVGAGGLKLRLDRTTGTWSDDTTQDPWHTDFHGAWVSELGEIWTVGGNYTAPASSIDARLGVIGYRGCAQPRWER